MDDFSFWDLIWTSLVVFFWITFLIIFFNVVFDLFRSRDLSGVKKAIWIVVLVVLPLIGTLIYVIARGAGMAERSARAQIESADRLRAAMEAQGIDAGGAGGDAATQIARGKELLDAGAISAEEFEALKKKALA